MVIISLFTIYSLVTLLTCGSGFWFRISELYWCSTELVECEVFPWTNYIRKQ
jgi:hypothetical protein